MCASTKPAAAIATKPTATKSATAVTSATIATSKPATVLALPIHS